MTFKIVEEEFYGLIEIFIYFWPANKSTVLWVWSIAGVAKMLNYFLTLLIFSAAVLRNVTDSPYMSILAVHDMIPASFFAGHRVPASIFLSGRLNQ